MIPQNHKIDFVKGETFYCHICDSSEHMVDSDKPETGSFFATPFGHGWNPDKQQTTEDYGFVIFAVCANCLTIPDNASTEEIQAHINRRRDM